MNLSGTPCASRCYGLLKVFALLPMATLVPLRSFVRSLALSAVVVCKPFVIRLTRPGISFAAAYWPKL